MAIEITYGSREEIPEGMEDHYVETDDGQYKLDAPGLKTETDVANVKEALDKERKLRRDAEKKANQLPEDFDPEEWDRLKELKKKQKDGKTSDEEDLELKQLKNKAQELENENKTLTNTLQSRLKRGGLSDALEGKNVLPGLKAGAISILSDKVEVVKQDGDYVAVDKETGKPLDEMVADWAETEEGKNYFKAPDTSGGGNKPGEGAKGDFSHIKSRSDFQTRKEKSDYIDKYGRDKYLKLPAK